MQKKILAVLLVVLMVVSMFAACKPSQSQAKPNLRCRKAATTEAP